MINIKTKSFLIPAVSLIIVLILSVVFKDITFLLTWLIVRLSSILILLVTRKETK